LQGFPVGTVSPPHDTAEDMTSAAKQVDDGPDASARLFVTDRARRVLGRFRRDYGPQALLLSWPGGAT
jgi:hypothetical protein